jgi:hypothetical protein
MIGDLRERGGLSRSRKIFKNVQDISGLSNDHGLSQ